MNYGIFMLERIPWLFVSFSLACIDQACKSFVNYFLQNRQSLVIFPFFEIVIVHNSGAVFGFLAEIDNVSHFLIISGVLIMLFIGYILCFSRLTHIKKLGFSVLLGGAIGNWIDRIIRGQVTDFFLLHYNEYCFPVFNMADVFISSGMILLIIEEVIFKKGEMRLL